MPSADFRLPSSVVTAQQRPADVRVTLLRGINVGRAKRVAMADLRAIVESLGYLNVRTVLNSGNVVFTVPAGRKGDAAVAIEQAIATGLGVQSRVIVITAADVCEIVTKHPLASLVDKPSRLQVLVLADPARRRSRPLACRAGRSGRRSPRKRDRARRRRGQAGSGRSHRSIPRGRQRQRSGSVCASMDPCRSSRVAQGSAACGAVPAPYTALPPPHLHAWVLPWRAHDVPCRRRGAGEAKALIGTEDAGCAHRRRRLVCWSTTGSDDIVKVVT